MSTTVYKNHILNDFQNYPDFAIERALQTQIIDECTYSNTFQGVASISSALDKLFYQFPTVQATMNQTQWEKGSTASGLTLSWTPHVYATLVAQNITGYGSVPVGTTSHTYSGSYTSPQNFTVQIVDAQNNFANAVVNLHFDLYSYWGQSALTSPDQATIKAQLGGGSVLELDNPVSRANTVTGQAGGGNYLYYAYPASWGLLTGVIINGMWSTWNQTALSLTNNSGHSETYYCYTSPYQTSGVVAMQFI